MKQRMSDPVQVRYLVLIRKDDRCMKQVPVDPTIQINEILGKKNPKYLFPIILRITIFCKSAFSSLLDLNLGRIRNLNIYIPNDTVSHFFIVHSRSNNKLILVHFFFRYKL